MGVRAALVIASKDVRSELSGGGTLAAMLVYSLLVLVVFSYVLPGGDLDVRAPVLWVSLVLGALVGFSHLFAAEAEDEAASALLLAPVDPAIVYLGKLAGSLALLAVLDLFLLPIFLVLYHVDLDLRVVRLAAVLAAGSVGVAAIGTVLSAMSFHLRSGGFLVPILALPVLVPLVLGAVAATRQVLFGEPLSSPLVFEPLGLIAAFDLVFTGASALLFKPILAKE